MKSNKENNEFLELLEPILPALSRFARAMSRNNDDAKDIISETVLRAFENYSNLRDKASFKSYLFTIASRYFKKTNKRASIFESLDAKVDFDKPDDSMHTDSLPDIEFLYKMMDLLPNEQREALILFEISGFKIQEIAKLQDATESAVKSRLKRGREKLSELMTEKKNKPINELQNIA